MSFVQHSQFSVWSF